MNLDINSVKLERNNISLDTTKTEYQYNLMFSDGSITSHTESEFRNLIEEYLNWFGVGFNNIHFCISISGMKALYSEKIYYVEIDGKLKENYLENKQQNEYFVIDTNDFEISVGDIVSLKNHVSEILSDYKKHQYTKI